MKFSTILLLAFASTIALSSGTSKEPDWKRVSNICYKLLRASPAARAHHDRDQFNPDPESQCVTRCVGIITGMYDDETGISMQQLDAWRDDDDDAADFEEFQRNYLACVGKIKPEQYGDDYCRKSFKYHECFALSG